MAGFSRFALYVLVHCSVEAIDPTLLLFRLLIKAAFAKPFAADRPVKNFVNIGSATQVAQPGAKVVPPLAARFAFALLNSVRKPFSKILISLKSTPRYSFTAWLPAYLISNAVSLKISRSMPNDHWFT